MTEKSRAPQRMQRLRYATEPEVLGLSSTCHVVMRGSDALWSAARVAGWVSFLPWSMLLTGISGPGAFRHGHRGPLRRGLARALRRVSTPKAMRVHSTQQAMQQKDGAVLCACGMVRCQESHPNIEPAGAVYRRTEMKVTAIKNGFTSKHFLVQESAVDFDIVLESGTVIAIEIANSILVPSSKWSRIPSPDLDLSIASEKVRQALEGAEIFKKKAVTSVLREGDMVQCLGARSQILDPNVTQRLPRDIPFRPSLKSPQSQPLLISIAKDPQVTTL